MSGLVASYLAPVRREKMCRSNRICGRRSGRNPAPWVSTEKTAAISAVPTDRSMAAFASPVSTAATQQLWACLPNLSLQEIYPFRVPEHWAIVDHAPELDIKDGYIPISERPGLGIELNQKTVDPFLWAECKLATKSVSGPS